MGSGTRRADHERSPRRGLVASGAAAVVLAALALLAFGGTLDNGYHLDDWYRIVGNPGVEHLQPWWRHFVDPSTNATLPRLQQYRPLLPLSLSLDFARAGGRHDLATYHATNLALHVLACWLVFLLLGEIVRQARAARGDDSHGHGTALAAAALYAVHPVAGVPVNYLCARDLLFMQVGLLGALLVFVRMRARRGDSWLGWTGAWMLLAFAMLGKTNAVAASGLVLLYEIVLGPDAVGSRPRRVRAFGATWRTALAATPAAAFFAWTHLGLTFSDLDKIEVPTSPLTYALTQARVQVAFYLKHVLWPYPMRVLPEAPLVEDDPLVALARPEVALGLALAVFAALLAWRLRRRVPEATFALCAYAIALAPTSSFVPLRYAATDYRVVPGLPWLLLALVLLARRVLPARARAAAGCIAIVWFGVAAQVTNAHWKDDRTLWTHSVAYGGDATARYNLAVQLMADDSARARELLEGVLDEIPEYIVAHISLGLLDVREGHVDAGLLRIAHAVQRDPSRPDSWRWQGKAQLEAGRPSDATASFEQAIVRTPGLPPLDDLLAAARAAQAAGDDRTALRWLDALHERAPEGYAGSRFVEAWSHHRPCLEPGVSMSPYVRAIELQAAVDAYDRHLARSPDDAQATYNRAHALQTLGRRAEAIAGFERTLQLAPDHRGARVGLDELADG